MKLERKLGVVMVQKAYCSMMALPSPRRYAIVREHDAGYE